MIKITKLEENYSCCQHCRGWSSSVKKDRPLFSVIITDVYDHDTELSLCADCLKELQKAITKALK